MDREVCWNVFVCRFAVSGCGETQEEHLSEVAHLIHEFAAVESFGMAMTMEQVVTQLQQGVFTLKAQVADQTGLSDAVASH